MANFEIAFYITLSNEGDYSNNPADKGGETYKGISRKNFPNWGGWNIIDLLKKTYLNSYQQYFAENRELYDMVHNFYKKEFWDKLKLDYVLVQEIANEVFDTSVNMGVGKGAIFLQQSLNLLNRNQKDYQDLKEDGIIGDKTISVLNSHKYPKAILRTLNGLQFMRYVEICKNDKTQEIFMFGWLNRT